MRPLAQEILAHLPGETQPHPGSPPAHRTTTPSWRRSSPRSRRTSRSSGAEAAAATRSTASPRRGLAGAEMVACNTDAQHLLAIHAPRKILLGRRLTRGLGAGALPQVGEQAAHEAEDEIKKALANSDMVFITLGLGGGTGTGSAPVVAQAAKDANGGNPLTIAVCTLPFASEGLVRNENAMWGLEKLREHDRHRHHDPQRPPPRARSRACPSRPRSRSRTRSSPVRSAGSPRSSPVRASSTSTSTTSARS